MKVVLVMLILSMGSAGAVTVGSYNSMETCKQSAKDAEGAGGVVAAYRCVWVGEK